MCVSGLVRIGSSLPQPRPGKLVPPTVALPLAKSVPVCIAVTSAVLHGLHLAGPQLSRYIPPDTEKSAPLKLNVPKTDPMAIVPLVMAVALARSGQSARRADVSSSFINFGPGSIYWKS